MKRGTPRHPKILGMSTSLDIPRYAAAGILEMLWHFAAEFALDGAIGKYPDGAIAEAIGYKGDATELIRALTINGWLEPCICHRLRIHDWPDHADQTVRRVLANRGIEFAPCYDTKESGFLYLARQESRDGPVKIGFSENPQSRIDDLQVASPHPITLLAIIPGSRADEAALHAQYKEQNIHREWFKCSESILKHFGLYDASMDAKLPKANTRKPKANTNTGAPARDHIDPGEGFDEFWAEWPKERRTGKAAALKAWKATVKKRPATGVILDAVRAQKKGQLGVEPKFIPHPERWIRGLRWNDPVVKQETGHTVGRPQPQEFPPDPIDDEPPATPEQVAAITGSGGVAAIEAREAEREKQQLTGVGEKGGDDEG